KRVLIGALLVMAVAIALFPLIRETWHAFALNLLLGTGSGAFWPSQSSLVSGLMPADRRHEAFAVQRVTMNLGVALGGVVGGLMGVLWAGVMLAVGAAGYWTGGLNAAMAMWAAGAVFALGECLHGTIHLALAADLAQPGLMGRYLAFSSQSWQIGWIVGPAVG